VDNFIEIPFPSKKEIVYQIGIILNDSFSPFYIGQSSRNIGRLGDYISAKFSASTDFKVGEAVRYLYNKNYQVVVRYSPSDNKLEDESRLLIKCKRIGLPMLNDLKGYDYKTAIEMEEREKIQDYVEYLLSTIRENELPSS